MAKRVENVEVSLDHSIEDVSLGLRERALTHPKRDKFPMARCYINRFHLLCNLQRRLILT